MVTREAVVLVGEQDVLTDVPRGALVSDREDVDQGLWWIKTTTYLLNLS